MNDNSNNIPKAIGKITLLSIVILIPLLIVFNYEAWKLQLKDFESIKKDTMDSMVNLKERKRANEQFISIINKEIRKIVVQGSYQTSINDQISEIFEDNKQISILKKAYFKKNIVINILYNKCHQFQHQQLQLQFQQQFKRILEYYSINFDVKIWKKGMNLNQMSNHIILAINQLKMQYFQENTALKIRKGDYRHDVYLRQISRQLNNMPSLSQCRFSNIQCLQKTIILFNHKEQKQGGYWEVDQQLYCADQFDSTTFFNIICDIFGISKIVQLEQTIDNHSVSKQLLSLLHQRQQIEQIQKALNYVSFIFQSNSFNLTLLLQKLSRNPEEALRYLKNGEFITPYLHTETQLQIINHFLNWIRFPLSKQLQSSIISDSRIGQIDLFPNDFKIGVYLPIFVLFIYPLILKLKQLFSFLFFKKSKPKSEQ